MPEFEWEPRFAHSGLALRQKGERKAVVIRLARGSIAGPGVAALYDGFVGDRCVYRAADEFKVGQVVTWEPGSILSP